MINVSENVLNACNSDSVTYVEYIIINGQKIIVKANLSDECYSNGHFVGTFIMKKLEFETENDIDYKKQEFVYYREVDGENFKIGTFIVTDVNDSDTNETVKVTAYDYTLKFANPYVTELDYASLKVTMNDVIDEVCAKVGVQRENQKLANGDFIVDSNQFDTSAQYGNVVQAVAQMSGNFAKINENDKLEFIFKKAPQKTVQGSNIHIEDSTNENVLFKLNGNSKQEGIPTPENKVDVETVGSNINLFDKDNANILTAYLDTNNSKIATTPTTKTLYIPCNANTTYTVSKISSKRFAIAFTDNIPAVNSTTNNAIENLNGGTSLTQTSTATSKYLCVYYYKSDIDTLTEQEILDSLKIEESEKATPWSPYGMGSVEIENVNKNFIKIQEMNKTEIGLDISTNKNVVNINGTATSGKNIYNFFEDIKLKKGTYTFSFISQNAPAINSCQFVFRDENNAGIVTLNGWGETNAKTVTLEKDTVISSEKSSFYTNKNITFSNTKYELQIEKGESATEIIEPQSQTKIMPIQQEMLEGDYIEEVEYHTWGKVVLTGNESWSLTDTNTFYLATITDYAISNNIPISNYFEGHSNIGSSSTITNLDNVVAFGISHEYYRFYIRCKDFSTIEEFKTWLQEKYNSGNPVVVHYKLATPKSLPLTEEQKEVMNGGIQLYEDVTNITTDNDLAILDITYSSNNVEIIEDYTELDDKRDTRPITIVSLGMTDVEGENVTLKWEEGIEQYGENYLVINDNPFAYTEEKRTQLIQAIFNRVKGFGYSAFETKYAFKPYIQCGDLVKLKNKEGQLIDSIILRISTNHDDITLSAPSIIDATVEYEQPLNAIEISKRTEYIVNKQEQKITQIVQKQDDFDNQLAEVNVSLEGISQKVENIADLTREVSGTKSIILENCVAGSLLELNILGNNIVFDYLYPTNDLYPSDNLFPYGDSRIEVMNFPNGSEEGTSVIYELGIKDVLRQNGDIKDEYILKEGKAQVIRRINKDGTVKQTEEIEDLGAYYINLLEGTNIIIIKNYTAILSAKYAIKSDYTDVFATKVEMQSSIKQTAEEINLEVRKKVDENEIISSINQSAEQVQINANKVSLKRKTN